MDKEPTICVVIPCFNEESTIGKVIDDFRKELPQAEMIVFDNNSTDRTASIAKSKNATVVRVNRKGKGSVVQAIFAHVQSDIIVLVDGDDTYPVKSVHPMVDCIQKGEADMVVGTRLETPGGNGMRWLHRFGNHLLTGFLNFCFRTKFKDILSGYRVFSKNFVRHIPLITTGFQIETELTLQAIEQRMTIKEIPIGYKERPRGSHSKLHTFYDGYRILLTIAVLLRDHHPLRIFSAVALLMAFLSIGCYLKIANTFGTILAVALLLLSFFMFGIGMVLSSVNTRFRELHILLKRK